MYDATLDLEQAPAEEATDTAGLELFVATASFAQRRLWLLDRMQPGSSAYNVPVAVRLRGSVRAGILADALAELVARHETLRTFFDEEEGEPVQVIVPELRLDLPEIDLTALSAGRTNAEALLQAQEEARRPFDLGRAPLLRAFLFPLMEGEALLVLSLHHIVTDGWSLGILLRELSTLYAAFAAGLPSPLPDLPIQYADFAAWQREWLQGDVLEQKLRPWRQRLANAPAGLALLTDRPRALDGPQEGRCGVLPIHLGAALSAEVRQLARASGATLFMTLLAGFQALLSRHSGETDLVVGSPVANRNRLEIEGIIGFFVNLLALRGDLSGDPGFRQLLDRVREVSVEAFAHEDLPFEKLVEELRPDRRLQQNPLFSAVLAVQQGKAAPETSESWELVEVHPGTAKFELTLTLADDPAEIRGTWEYDAHLYDAATIDRLSRHLQVLLADAAAHPERPLSELRVMDAAEEQMLRADLNRAERTWARPVTVHDLFTRQVQKAPGRIAAVGPQGPLTYGEIEERSNALAGLIEKAAGGPRLDRRIGLLADAEPQVLIGMLGILKAGGGFVPVEPRHPDERVAWMLEDAACEVLVTQRRHLDRAQGLVSGPILCLEDAISSPPTRIDSEPRSLAYVVYTSGSTGQPKGVMVAHESLVPMLLWGCDYLGLGEHTRVLQTLSFCFDFGIFEQLTTLLAGGTIWFPGEGAGDPAASAREIAHHSVNTLHMTPVFARELAGAGAAGGQPLESVEVVHLGGESLSWDTVARLRAALPRAIIYNGYGPTEATVTSSMLPTSGPAEAHRDAGWPVVPIGRRSADNTLYILDRTGRLSPFGVRGEIHVGGIGVARGYLDRPELTAERFVPDAFGAAPGGRLYRTGDFARYLPGGDVEFLGRIDQQVKVRGFRVEPGEIEAALREHPEVREAAVIARPNAAGDLRLAAYVVLHPTDPSDAKSKLRAFLGIKLPPHMVPAFFAFVDALPLTPNGKLDRAALPDPEASEAAASGFVAPRTPVEEVLASLWSTVLRVERIGAFDNFFDLGGHSLTATAATALVRSTFQVELPTRAIFKEPVLADLAEQIEKLLLGREGLELPPITPLPRGSEVPASFAQQRLWFLDEMAGGATPYFNVVAPLLLTGTLDRAALARAFDEIVRRHEALRTTFHTVSGLPVQKIHPHRPLPLPWVDLSGLAPSHLGGADAEARRLALENTSHPFSLSRGPLLRITLLHLGGERHAVLLAMHHIISDGWSLEVFVSELAALYRAFAAGEPSPLRPLPVQYADFALWQRRQLTGQVLETQLAFWRHQLAGVPLVLELPLDRPRPAVQTYPGASAPVDLPGPLAGRLQALARQHRSTLFMALLTTLSVLLRRYTGRRDVVVGSPIANRNHAEIAGLIGFFVNMLPLRADLGGNPDFVQALDRVREMALGAYAHQDLPFERLVEELQPVRDLSRHPLFQVGVAISGTPWHAFDLPGVTLNHLEVAQHVEHYDLTLQAYQTSHGLVARFSYNTDLFEPATIERMGGYLEILLEAFVDDPARRIDDVPLLTGDERRQLLAARSLDVASPSPFVAELVARQAAERPEAAAVLWEEGELSYEELDRRANRLAHHLRALGVGPEVPVALAFDRTVDFGATLLAVWRAGGVAVPLDPEAPRERLAWMLENSGAWVIVTRGDLLAGARPDLPRVDLDADRQALARHPSTPPPLVLEPENAAYILFTSGSTGRPKGVLISHEAFASHCVTLARRLAIGPADRVLQTAAFVFDLSLEELFSTWVAGAALFPWDSARGPVELSRILAREGITYSNIPTPLWHQAAREWASGRVPVEAPGLRWMSVGGEAHPPGSLALWRQTPLSHAILLNGYGPTEATVTATLHFGPALDEEAGPDLFRLGIGQPLADRVVALQDGAGELVPPGIPAELCIGGPTLARGYVGRPDLTAAVFVPDPWSLEPGARLYRTGDLVRRRNDGVLDFLGRRDAQLKLRGYRIEAGEVEAALLKHPGVHAAAVALVDRDGTPETRSLVAWYIPAAGSRPTTPELREHLRGLLPAYMVPAAFVEMETLPRTASGKLERAALPRLAPPYATKTAETAPTPQPRVEPAPITDSLDCIVADIWKEALGIDAVRPDDNFFDLGGHSMLLSRVRARLQETLGTDLSMIDMFNAPTVRALAASLRRDLGPPAPQPQPEALASTAPKQGTEIAIIGMAGQFPGAADVDALWRNLSQGVESITFFKPDWKPPGGSVYHVPARGRLEGADLWDAAFFGFNAREAEMMDPQHRLFLECAWQAMENAGYAPGHTPGPVAVFGGASREDYHALLVASGALADLEGSRLASIGTDFLTSRVSYKLSLEGPSFDVQSACATSLVAVHLACQSLLSGECAMALAGGVAISGQPESGYIYQKGGQLSADGHCRAFDARGEGSVDADGVALVVLKRLEDALADGDHVHAVIKATGINNDGSEKVGFLAPRMASQTHLVRQTLEKAGVPADTVGLLEAHGNGTPHGDPIEIAALTDAFRAQTDRTGFCALGSIKTNIGHTHGAAGVASLIKAVLALENRLIPPVLHFGQPNPALDLESGPFYVNTEPVPWETNGHPRRAGVSSYGAGGTKVHVVLEEAPGRKDTKDSKDNKGFENRSLESLKSLPSLDSQAWHLLVLSARTPAALERAAANLAAHLEHHPDLSLADVAFTLQTGRRHFEHRRGVLCRTHEEALAGLRTSEPLWAPPGGENSLGHRWLAGEDVDWSPLHGGANRRRVPLPTYPFEKQRYWVEATGPDIPRFTPPEELKPEPGLVGSSC